MSSVTNVMMQFCGATIVDSADYDDCLIDDHDKIAAINEITSRLCLQNFGDITLESWGGEKYPECELLGAAFNYFPLDDFFKEIAVLAWKEPSQLRVFVQTESMDVFSVWVLRDRKMVCVLEGY